MKRQDRPLPYPPGPIRTAYIHKLIDLHGFTRERATKLVNFLNNKARNSPLPNEKCEAHARTTGMPCQAPAMANGRCKLHGGLSTGAKTPEGRIKIYGHV